MAEMTDREKHLRLALDALVVLEEAMAAFHDDNPAIDAEYPGWHDLILTAGSHIEAAAMPKPSIIRRWFGRKEAA